MSDSRIIIGDLRPADIALLKMVASEAAEQAVSRTFIAMGLDPAKPMDAQADMQWVRSTRIRSGGVWDKIVLTIVGAISVAAASAIWLSLSRGPHP
jgi:hypothetical protein